MKKSLAIISALLLSNAAAATTPKEVLVHYSDLAQAVYGDSLTTAQALQKAVKQFTQAPTEANLQMAKETWVAARHPYQQTEAYRFGNPIVDNWEGKVNAWPLDEGLIDYVNTSYGVESDENPLYSANIIAHPKLQLSNKLIDAQVINKTLLSETLHEVDDVETNVATGYHAIEFLLWGQDINGTGPGAGARPASDYDVNNCSNGNCQRRADYLNAAAELLVDDLQWIVRQWGAEGAARKAVIEGSLQANLGNIFMGLGSLSYGELAGERMKLGLMLHDPEEEHDCFSDNTHWSHFDDALGIKNVYTGNYMRVNGEKLSGPSLSDLVAAKNMSIDKLVRNHLNVTLKKMQTIVDSAEKQGIAYDQLIAQGNTQGNAKVQAAIDALVSQTHAIEKAVKIMGLDTIAFEGSDSLDKPSLVN